MAPAMLRKKKRSKPTMPSVALTPATRPDQSILGRTRPQYLRPKVSRVSAATPLNVAAARAGIPSPADGSGPTPGIPGLAFARTGHRRVGLSSVVSLVCIVRCRASRDVTAPRAWPRGLADPPQARGYRRQRTDFVERRAAWRPGPRGRAPPQLEPALDLAQEIVGLRRERTHIRSRSAPGNSPQPFPAALQPAIDNVFLAHRALLRLMTSGPGAATGRQGSVVGAGRT